MTIMDSAAIPGFCRLAMPGVMSLRSLPTLGSRSSFLICAGMATATSPKATKATMHAHSPRKRVR